MVGATIDISRLSEHDLPRDFAQYATAGRFWQILANFYTTRPDFTAQRANGRPNIARIANNRQ
jgi:hypothetical protein